MLRVAFIRQVCLYGHHWSQTTATHNWANEMIVELSTPSWALNACTNELMPVSGRCRLITHFQRG